MPSKIESKRSKLEFIRAYFVNHGYPLPSDMIQCEYKDTLQKDLHHIVLGKAFEQAGVKPAGILLRGQDTFAWLRIMLRDTGSSDVVICLHDNDQGWYTTILHTRVSNGKLNMIIRDKGVDLMPVWINYCNIMNHIGGEEMADVLAI